jgi:putative cardiolipin synthase
MVTLSRVTAALAMLVLAACATVPSDYPKTPSHALDDTASTELGRRAARWGRDLGPGESGFFVMTEGVDALAARLALADRAERSIDAQYYIIHGDLVGDLFVDRLLAAADRGVRVRLLIDDFYTLGEDSTIAAIASHPNLELRIFNPFAHRSAARYTEFITDLDRVDHRMHNKSFTVDNQVAVVGGRNIAEEYFDAKSAWELDDMDVLAVGPVVKGVSAAFDVFWNSEFAIPAEALVKEEGTPETLKSLRAEHARTVADPAASVYLDGLQRSVVENVGDPRLPFFQGPATVVYDEPAKVTKPHEEARTIRSQLASRVHAARSELMVVSPYFVLPDELIAVFRQLRERGVRVVVLTNSLASTDVVPVHAGYRRARRPLLEAGVEMHEIKPDVTFDEEGKSGREFEHTGLHMKSFIIDRRYMFVGSFNWDPRSAKINTEIGVFVDSPEMAGWGADLLQRQLPIISYRVRLDDDGELEWVDASADGTVVYTREPKAGTWLRFQAWLAALFPRQEL